MQAKLVDAISKAFFIRAFTPHPHFFKTQTFVTGKSALEIYTSANTSSIIHLCFIIDFCGLKTIFFDGSIVQVLLGEKKKVICSFFSTRCCFFSSLAQNLNC